MHEHRVHVHNEVTCFAPIQKQSTLVDAHTYIHIRHTLHSTSAAYKLQLNWIYYLSNSMS